MLRDNPTIFYSNVYYAISFKRWLKRDQNILDKYIRSFQKHISLVQKFTIYLESSGGYIRIQFWNLDFEHSKSFHFLNINFPLTDFCYFTVKQSIIHFANTRFLQIFLLQELHQESQIRHIRILFSTILGSFNFKIMKIHLWKFWLHILTNEDFINFCIT